MNPNGLCSRGTWAPSGCSLGFSSVMVEFPLKLVTRDLFSTNKEIISFYLKINQGRRLLVGTLWNTWFNTLKGVTDVILCNLLLLPEGISPNPPYNNWSLHLAFFKIFIFFFSRTLKMYCSTVEMGGSNDNCYLKSIMILHYIFCKYLVLWMSPSCITMFLETELAEFWYQHNFRYYCRVDIAYKTLKFFQRGSMLTVWVVLTTVVMLRPHTWFSSALGQFMELRVPLHSGHLHNSQHCVCNDWSMTARDCYWQGAVLDLSSCRAGLHLLVLTFCMCSICKWPNMTKWMTYTAKFFRSTSLIGRVSFILELWCFKSTGV